ncbi:MAG TPA: hypothetical protein VKA06_07145 [Spirochaetia bacterium]|nr:hypothetical protein [Spirochaetia bacterium]
MGDPSMVLREEDVRRIGDYVKPWLRDVVSETVPRGSMDIPTQLLERMVRVEEELKAQRELFAERFSASDRRFEDTRTLMDQRFEDSRTVMDQRFEDTRTFMDQRFDDTVKSMNQRFASMQWAMLVGFSVVTAVVTVFGLLA